VLNALPPRLVKPPLNVLLVRPVTTTSPILLVPEAPVPLLIPLPYPTVSTPLWTERPVLNALVTSSQSKESVLPAPFPSLPPPAQPKISSLPARLDTIWEKMPPPRPRPVLSVVTNAESVLLTSNALSVTAVPVLMTTGLVSTGMILPSSVPLVSLIPMPPTVHPLLPFPANPERLLSPVLLFAVLDLPTVLSTPPPLSVRPVPPVTTGTLVPVLMQAMLISLPLTALQPVLSKLVPIPLLRPLV